jgi:hypothetical protein
MVTVTVTLATSSLRFKFKFAATAMQLVQRVPCRQERALFKSLNVTAVELPRCFVCQAPPSSRVIRGESCRFNGSFVILVSACGFLTVITGCRVIEFQPDITPSHLSLHTITFQYDPLLSRALLPQVFNRHLSHSTVLSQMVCLPVASCLAAPTELSPHSNIARNS